MSGERVRQLVTPEGVPLNLVLADAGERLAAFLLDVGLMVLLLVALTLLAAAVFTGTDVEPAGIIWLVGFFVLRNFYFAAFEMQPRAATPGKRVLGLRVAARNGGRLDADAIVARNLLRELELFLPLSLLGLLGRGAGGWLLLLGYGWALLFTLLPLFNRDRLRAGDLLAGTWVVRVPRQALLRDLAVESGQVGIVFTGGQLAAYGEKELYVLEGVLRGRNQASVAAVAARIRAKTGWEGTARDDAFLEAYYAALRARLERGLLFGQRQRDKFDRGTARPTRTPPRAGP